MIGELFTNDGAVLDLFHAIFWMIVITQPINAIAYAFDGAYKGLGEGKILRNVLIASTLFFFIPVAVGGNALDWKLYAIWSAFLVWMLARGVLLAIHFEKHFGKASLRIRART